MVVLDDYHLVSNLVIHAGVDQLLVEAPAALRLVIATRHDPPLALSRLRSHGALRELRFDERPFAHRPPAPRDLHKTGCRDVP